MNLHAGLGMQLISNIITISREETVQFTARLYNRTESQVLNLLSLSVQIGVLFDSFTGSCIRLFISQGRITVINSRYDIWASWGGICIVQCWIRRISLENQQVEERAKRMTITCTIHRAQLHGSIGPWMIVVLITAIRRAIFRWVIQQGLLLLFAMFRAPILKPYLKNQENAINTFLRHWTVSLGHVLRRGSCTAPVSLESSHRDNVFWRNISPASAVVRWWMPCVIDVVCGNDESRIGILAKIDLSWQIQKQSSLPVNRSDDPCSIESDCMAVPLGDGISGYGRDGKSDE